jgi:hypothetical protein
VAEGTKPTECRPSPPFLYVKRRQVKII